MMKKEECDWAGCENKPGPHHFIHGTAYCREHYPQALEKHFLNEFERWQEEADLSPSKKFRNLFGRYVESLYRGESIPGHLSKGRLQYRTYNFQKVEEGLKFSIVRHLGAWTPSKPTQKVEQIWKFNIDKRQLELLEESKL